MNLQHFSTPPRQMAMIVIPSKKVYSEMLENISCESFFFDYDLSGILILYLKLYPNLAISVINGAPIDLVFRHPEIEKDNITLYIHDIVDTPYYISKTITNEQANMKDYIFNGLAKYVSYFEANNMIRVAIFDETIKNIFAADTSVIKPFGSLRSWYSKIVANPVIIPKFNYNNPQESELTGYMIRVNPLNCSSSSSYVKLSVKHEWGEKPYIESSNKYIDSFDILNYSKTGSLGFFQEQNIKEILSEFYIPGLQLFPSPRLINGTELTDVVFGMDGYLVLLESKTIASYDGNKKNVRNKSKSATMSINKACTQLMLAEKIVKENVDNIADPSLFEHCIFAERIIKICLISDSLIINTKSLSESLKEFNKYDLPIIMSLRTFYEILFRLKNPIKILNALDNIESNLSTKEGLPILAGIS